MRSLGIIRPKRHALLKTIKQPQNVAVFNIINMKKLIIIILIFIFYYTYKNYSTKNQSTVKAENQMKQRASKKDSTFTQIEP